MRRANHPVLGAFAAATIIVAVSLASATWAADNDAPSSQPGMPTMEAPPMGNPAPNQGMMHEKMMHGKGMMHEEKMMDHGSMEKVDARIKMLHGKLKITSDQEQSWAAVAQVMRDNQKAIHDLIMERRENGAQMSAVDDLQSYQKIADEHAEGLRKLIPVFTTLYDSMSDSQKRNADEIFGRYEGHRHAGESGRRRHHHHK